MKKNCFGKILVIGLMILFVGASVLPGIGGKINQSVTINNPQSMGSMTNWYEDFESYALYQYLDGGPDDGGWEPWAGDPAAGAYVTNNQSASPTQSVELVGWADLVHKYSGVTSGNWTYTAWQYIPTDFAGETYFILCDWYEDGGASTHWAVQLRCSSIDGLISSEFGEENLPLILGQWVEIRVEIDFGADEKTVYYDGVELVTSGWTDGMNPGGHLNLGAVDLYAGDSPTTSVYYDNMSLEGEPGEDPDLFCEGELRWEDVGPGSALEGSFKVRNIGGSGSELDWNITHEPSWGEWNFTPSSGDDLTPEDGNFSVEVDAIAPPDANTEFNGKVRVENREDPNDFCEILVYIRTPRSKTLPNTLFMRVLEKFLNAFPILQRLLNL
jgi:hypothetical protein